MRPKTKTSWVTNATTGKEVSPNLDWLIERLASLNPQAAKERPDVIDHHAHQIYGRWLSLRWRGDNAAIKIRGTQRPYAKRVAAKSGTKKELKRLLTAAMGTSDKRFLTAWLGVSSKTLGMVDWNPGPQQKWRGGFEIVVRGHHAIMPTRADAVPLIEDAIREHEATPAEDRRKRKPDDLADDLVRAVAVAYRDLTGERGFIWNDVLVRHQGGLVDLGRDIDDRFGGTALFTVDRIKNIF